MSNTLNVSNPIVLARLAADPAQAEEGEIYYNTTLDCFRQYANEAWSNLGAPLSKSDVGLSNLFLNHFFFDGRLFVVFPLIEFYEKQDNPIGE